jgi:hypothetical protein
VINLDNLSDSDDIILSSPLQLLQFNTQEHCAFADRLVEYLIENAITKDMEEIPNNIKRTQKVLELNSEYNNYNPTIRGLWEPRMNKLLYEYMTTRNIPTDVKHDLLGYVDKDVEKYYSNTRVETSNGRAREITNSILSVELEEDN